MYLFKQITKELLKNKLFVFLLFLLSGLNSFMYFFVQFSIDGNMKRLNSLSKLNQKQLLYQQALESNTILARNFLISLTVLTSFAFTMFFYRFFKSNGRQIGCFKALGYKNITLRSYFASFTIIVSTLGSLLGFVSGYLASDILRNAGKESFEVTGLVKTINLSSVIIGLIVPVIVFCIVTFLSYNSISSVETANLISGTNKQVFSKLLKLSDRITKILPVKNKFPYRIALRKPISVLLVVSAVMSFTTMFIMGYSLNLSSQKVFSSQTVGHKYLFDTYFTEIKMIDEKYDNSIYYLSSEVLVKSQDGKEIDQQIVGMEYNNEILELHNKKGELLGNIKKGSVYISPALNELYNFKIGDKITLTLDKKEYQVTIQDIAENAKLKSIYISKSELSDILNLPSNSYNGVLSMEAISENGGITTTYEQKIEELERDAVSNKISAVINQAIGCVVGIILLCLALLLNFQDNIKDMVVLHLMGYKPKEIRKLLVDVYRPIIIISFLITIIPSIMIVKSIKRSLSIQIGDYMPFQTNYLVILAILISINILYSLVQITFSRGIKNIIHKENALEYTSRN